MAENSEIRKEIERFLVEDGLDINATAFKYLAAAIENYRPGMMIAKIVKPVEQEYGITLTTFKAMCGKLTKSSLSMPGETLKRYIGYAYAKIMLK